MNCSYRQSLFISQVSHPKQTILPRLSSMNLIAPSSALLDILFLKVYFFSKAGQKWHQAMKPTLKALGITCSRWLRSVSIRAPKLVAHLFCSTSISYTNLQLLNVRENRRQARIQGRGDGGYSPSLDRCFSLKKKITKQWGLLKIKWEKSDEFLKKGRIFMGPLRGGRMGLPTGGMLESLLVSNSPLETFWIRP